MGRIVLDVYLWIEFELKLFNIIRYLTVWSLFVCHFHHEKCQNIHSDCFKAEHSIQRKHEGRLLLNHTRCLAEAAVSLQ